MRAIDLKDSYFKVETTFGKNPDEPKIFEFSVELRQYAVVDDTGCLAILGYLGGFVVRAGYLLKAAMSGTLTSLICAAITPWRHFIFWQMKDLCCVKLWGKVESWRNAPV